MKRHPQQIATTLAGVHAGLSVATPPRAYVLRKTGRASGYGLLNLRQPRDIPGHTVSVELAGNQVRIEAVQRDELGVAAVLDDQRRRRGRRCGRPREWLTAGGR